MFIWETQHFWIWLITVIDLGSIWSFSTLYRCQQNVYNCNWILLQKVFENNEVNICCDALTAGVDSFSICIYNEPLTKKLFSKDQRIFNLAGLSYLSFITCWHFVVLSGYIVRLGFVITRISSYRGSVHTFYCDFCWAEEYWDRGVRNLK